MKLDINAMCEFEEITGRSLLALLENTDNMRMSDIRALVQAGLELKDPKEAGDILMEYMNDKEQKPIFEVISVKMNESGITKKKEK